MTTSKGASETSVDELPSRMLASAVATSAFVLLVCGGGTKTSDSPDPLPLATVVSVVVVVEVTVVDVEVKEVVVVVVIPFISNTLCLAVPDTESDTSKSNASSLEMFNT